MTSPFAVQLAPLPVPDGYAAPAGLDLVPAFDAAALDLLDLAATRAVVTHSVMGVPDALWERLPSLELVANFGVGLDRIDLARARTAGVRVTYTPDALTADVADLAVAMTLSLLRRLPQADAFVRAGAAGRFPLATSVSGRRLGVLGFGRIGRAVAARAAAFGMEVGYGGRSRRADSTAAWFATPVELATWSDVLVAATPGGLGTKGLVSAEVIAALGPRGWFVNVARASVVDEAALARALRLGDLAGAGLEVFGGSGSRLPELVGDLPNVILTPHVGSATAETRTVMADAVYANVRALLGCRPLIDEAP